MSVQYNFRYEDGREVDFRVTDAPAKLPQGQAIPTWVNLDYCQCSNCPLNTSEHVHCPAAVAIVPVIQAFQAEDAYQKVDVTVTDERRSYHKNTTLEESLRSLLGLKLATSGCPLLSQLKPMAKHHLPFASTDEFIMRSVESYLLEQLFARRDGRTPDWDLKGLVERNQQLQLVNQALWQRIHAECRGDSNLKVLLSFFSMASSVSISLESQLRKLQSSVLSE